MEDISLSIALHVSSNLSVLDKQFDYTIIEITIHTVIKICKKFMNVLLFNKVTIINKEIIDEGILHAPC